MSRVLYVRTSLNRLSEYQVTTRILRREDGTRVVRKSAANPRATSFVRSLINKSQSLAMYALPFTIVPTTRFWHEVELPYIEGETLHERWTTALKLGDRSGLLSLCDEFRQLVHSLPSVTAPPNEIFIATFGVGTSTKEQYVEPGLIDLRFDNLIIDKHEKLFLVDYEWTVPFALPISFILFRAIAGWFASLVSYAPWRVISLSELLDAAGIPRSDVLRLESMEQFFQSSVHGGKKESLNIETLLRGDPLIGLAQLENFAAHQTVQNLKERLSFIEQNAAGKQQHIDQLQRLCDERGRIIEDLEKIIHRIEPLQQAQAYNQQRPGK